MVTIKVKEGLFVRDCVTKRSKTATFIGFLWGIVLFCFRLLCQCFSNAGPRSGTGTWHQLYRAARGSTGICHFSFLSNFHELMFYSGNILRREIFVNVSKNSDPDVGLRKLQYD